MLTIRTFSVVCPASMRIFALLLFSFAAFTNLDAQEKGPSREKRQEIEKAVSTFMAGNSVPGIGAAVVLDGQPLWSEGFGMADLENYSPANSSTLFRLGSISKPITATAALQLWERGKLDLDAPVQKYCPAFPEKEWPIATRELLGHLGGLRHYNPDGKGDIPEDSARHFAGMQESLQIFAGDPWSQNRARNSTIRPTDTRSSVVSLRAYRPKIFFCLRGWNRRATMISSSLFRTARAGTTGTRPALFATRAF